MKNGLFIAGDWGTSRLRLYLCEGAKVLHRKEGKGIGSGTGEAGDAKGTKTEDLGTYLFGLIGDWLEERGRLPIYLSGMVGSSIGWRITPYVECPASKEALSSSLTYFVYEGCDVYLVSGLACTNFFGCKGFCAR